MLYFHPKALLPASLAPETVFLLYAGTTSLIGIAVRRGPGRRLDRAYPPPGAARRFKTLGLALLFSLAISILAAPFLIENQLVIGRAIKANEAEINAFSQSYKAGLAKLVKIGALRRIEVEDDTVTHYIGGPLYQIGAKGLAEYARAAMVYNTLVLGKAPRSIVLRDATTEDPIGTYRPDGVFVLQTSATYRKPRRIVNGYR